MAFKTDLQAGLDWFAREAADRSAGLRAWLRRLARSRARIQVERLEPRMLFSTAAPATEPVAHLEKAFLDAITVPGANTAHNQSVVAQPASAPAVGGGLGPITISTPASASPSNVTGKTSTLSITVIDPLQQSSLIYTWATTGTPPAPVSFSANGTNSAATTTATFSAAGTYNFQVTVTAPGGGSAVSSVTVQVKQTATSIVVSPATPAIPVNNLQQFTATENDQFGNAMSPQPGINWSLTGGGTLSNAGLYLAPATTGTATVKATAGPISGTASVTIAAAGPFITPGGTETLVNTASTGGNQQLPAVAMDESGNYVVVWEDGAGGGEVNAQLYSATGSPVGAQFQVNTTPSGGNPLPSVAMNAAGQFAVCWNGNGNTVYAKLFNASGTALTPDTVVTSQRQGNTASGVGMASDGSFSIVYEGNATADNDGIYLQRYTAAGVASDAAILVNTTTTGPQVNPSIATDAQGDSVVAWTDKNAGQTIKAALVPASGAPSAAFLVGTSGANNEDLSSVGMDGAGNFVIAFAETGPTQGVYTRRYNATGTALDASPVPLSNPGAAQLTKPSIAVRLDGSYLVAWTAANNLDGNGNGIFAQLFNANGSANGGQFLVNTTTQGNQQVAATAWYNDDLLIAWDGQGVGDNQGIFQQRYNIAGVANVAPTIHSPPSQSVAEEGSLTLSSAAGNQFTVADSDSNGGVEDVQLISTNGTLTLGTTNNITLVKGTGTGDTWEIFTGTLSNLNAAINGLLFTPTPNYVGPASVQIWIDDLGNSGAGGAITTTSTLSITVNRSAHSPSVTSANTNENTQSANGLVITPNALDASMSGFFDITGITGGSLFENDGVTPISNGQFITFAQGQAGLRFTPTSNSTTSGAFNVQASTSGSASGLGGSVVADSITVNPVPQLSAPASGTTNEDSALTFSVANADAIVVRDPGNSNGSASLTLATTNGTFTLAGTAGLTISSGGATASTGITMTGPLSSLDAAMNGLQFLPAVHFSGSASLAITATEGSNTASATVPIDVIQVAHTPSITPASTTETAQTTSGLVITPNTIDASLSGFFKITAITNGTLFQVDGVTPISNGQFITFAQGEAGLTFTPSAGSASTGSFIVQASTVASDSGIGGSQITGTIAVTRRPTLTAEATPLSFIEGSAALAVSPLLTVSEPNGRAVTGATVRLNGYVAGQDALQFADQNGITGTWDSVNGVLTLTGSASAAAYQSALESVTYANSSADPSQVSRSAQFTVSDALFTSFSATRAINVVAINNAPTIAAPATQATIENVPLVFSAAAGNGIIVADVDSEAQPEQLTLTASAGTLVTSRNPGNPAATLTLTGTIAQLNQQLEGLTYTPAFNAFQPATITINIDDLGNSGQGGPQIAMATINVGIAPVAHTPTVTDASTLEEHRTTSGLVITPNPADQGLAGFYQITSITGGTLLQQNGSTVINNGDFITFAQGAAGLRFSPSPGSISDGSFAVQSSVSNSAAGLGGSVVQATINVIAMPLVVRNDSLNVPNQNTVTITSSELKTTSPAGSGDAILYTVVSLPADGTLLLNGAPLGMGGTFTAANINSGTVQYTPGSGTASADSFQFVATDSAGRTSGANTFHIVFAAPTNVPLIPTNPAAPAASIPASTPVLHGAANDDSTLPSSPSSDPTGPADPASSDTTIPAVAPAAQPVAPPAPVAPANNPVPAPAKPSAVPQAAPTNAVSAAPKASAVAAVPAAILAKPVEGPKARRFTLNAMQVGGVAKTFDQQSRLWADLDAMKQNMTSEFAFKAWAGTASFVSVGMSLAYFMWMFRIGSLVSSLLSSMPAWNFVDPLPILESMGSVRRGADDDEGLESLVTGRKRM